MLVEARDVEDFEEDLPTRKAPRSQLRVRPGLDEEYSSAEIAKMTERYEGTRSKKQADCMRVWERSREAHEKDEAVKGTLVKKSKGGVVVDLMGVDAFLPGSQIALRRVPNLDELLGQSFEFKIIKLNKRRRNIV